MVGALTKTGSKRKPLRLAIFLASGIAAVLLSWTAAAPEPMPSGITYAPGDLIVEDLDQSELSKVDPVTGAEQTIAAWDRSRWVADFAIRYTGAGVVSDFFIWMRFPSQFVRIDPYTGEQSVVLTLADEILNGHMEVDRNGDVLFTEFYSSTVMKIDPETATLSVVADGFAGPYALAIERNGNLLVGDTGGTRLWRVDPVANTKVVLSTGPFDTGFFGLAIDGNGDIIAAERRAYQEGTISRINKTTGQRTLISFGYPLSMPNGLDVEEDGDIVVADYKTGPGEPSYSGKILRVDPSTGDQTFVIEDDYAPMEIKVVRPPVWNIHPVADDLSLDANAGSAQLITLSASDPDGGALTYHVVAGPSHGTLSGEGPDLTYTANAAYYGPDSFTFKANDGTDDSNVATVTIAVNHVPVVEGKSVITDENSSLAITLGATTDIDGDPLTYSVLSGPGHGSISVAGGVVTYTPLDFYYGPDSFTFQANDTRVNSNIASVSITVRRVFTPTRFEAPIDNGETVNYAKAGSTIPVKWRLTDLDGTVISDPKTFVSLTSYQVSCATMSGEPADEVETYSGGSGLQYLGDGVWQFNWKTQKTYATQCRIMVLTLSDGSKYTADFRFKQ